MGGIFKLKYFKRGFARLIGVLVLAGSGGVLAGIISSLIQLISTIDSFIDVILSCYDSQNYAKSIAAVVAISVLIGFSAFVFVSAFGATGFWLLAIDLAAVQAVNQLVIVLKDGFSCE